MIVDCVRRDNKVFFIKKLETKATRMITRIVVRMMRMMMMVIRVGRI